MPATEPKKKRTRNILNHSNVKRQRKMLDFSSIPLHLQIEIAEKIDYFDQIEFELSSKHGKDVINFTKHKAVVELRSITCLDNDIELFFAVEHFDRETDKRRKKCTKLLQFPYLPRFKVKEIQFYKDASIAPLIEMCGRQLFTANEVFLEWCWPSNDVPDFSTLLNVFFKFFNVTYLFLSVAGPIDKSLFMLPKIREMRMLRTRRICLIKPAENRISVTTNLFLKEWFAKKRSIEWFQTERYAVDWLGSIKEEIVFSGLSYSVIWKYNEDKKNTRLTFLKYCGGYGRDYYQREKYYMVNETTTVYSIDRGDSKLLIVVSPGFVGRDRLMAQECTELDDVIRIELL